MPNLASSISLHTLRHSSQKGMVKIGHLYFPCAIGKSGRKFNKVEGDHASPRGRWRLLYCYYRSDKIPRPHTHLMCMSIKQKDLWCDDPNSKLYNKPTKEPLKYSAEKLCREDDQYDLVIVLDYNINPCIKNKGSAIFIHIRKNKTYSPTQGCIAFKKSDLIKILQLIKSNTNIYV